MLIEDLASALDSRDQIDLIILDFCKAFDKVSHQRLLLKLNQFGIKGNILRWIESFLTSRTQQVVLEGATSHQDHVTSGVPHGPVLGPLLFLIYINDIENSIDSQLRLFADDCLQYRVIKSALDRVNLQNDISQLCDWESTWQMTFNSSKCFVMHMSHKKNPWLTTYIMQDVPLQSSITQKYLGVEETSNLDWNIHINTITTKANKTLGLLRRHLGCCSPATKETAYKALVRPQMEYCSAVWDQFEKGDTETLEKVQRRAARFVKGDYRQQSSVTQMIKDHGWQSLQERRAISRLSKLCMVCAWIFPRTIFAFLLKLPYGQFTHPLSRYPCIYEKNFQKFLRWKKFGGGGGGCNSPPPPS